MDKPKRKQKTPKGYEIPVPKRDEVLGDLRKLAKGSASSGPKK